MVWYGVICVFFRSKGIICVICMGQSVRELFVFVLAFGKNF